MLVLNNLYVHSLKVKYSLRELARQVIDTKDQKLDKVSDPYDANKLRSYVPRRLRRSEQG